MRKLLVVLGDALFRPARFISSMNKDDCYRSDAWLATLLWLVLTNGLIVFLAQRFFPIAPVLVVTAVLKSVPDAITFSSYAMVINGIISSRNQRLDGFQIIVKQPAQAWSGVLFWFLYGQIHLTPLCLGFSLLRMRALPWDRNLVLGGLLMLGLGLMIGTMITIILGYFDSAQTARRVMALSSLIMVGVLGVLGEVATTIGWLILLGGVFLGITRLIPWFWQAVLSICLLGLGRLKHPIIWKLHPAAFDELTFFPLPGLTKFLIRLYEHDPQRGVAAMLRIYGYGGQRRAIRRALQRIIDEQKLTTTAFLALSTDPAGASMLRELTEQLHRTHPLIEIYAQLSAVAEPHAWPIVIAELKRHSQAFEASLDGMALWSFLQAAHNVLTVHEWSQAVQQLANMPQVEGDSIWDRASMSLHAEAVALTHSTQLAQTMPLNRDLQLQKGWPAYLLATVIEHLHYLRRIQVPSTM